MTEPKPLAQHVLERASEGYRATLLAQAVRVACKAASVMVMARLVSPADHGRYAMASSVFLVLVLFRDMGLGTAAIQSGELDDEQRGAIWRAHVVLGLLLAAATLALGPAVAAFYREPSVTGLLAAMSGGFVLVGINAWPRVLLARELRFQELNRLEATAAILGTVAMIGSAAAGAGAYSFVVFLLASEGISAVIAWRICAWRPGAGPRWGALRGLARTGLHVTGSSVLATLVAQLDSVFMGRWFGPAALGFYNRPNQMLALPSQHLGGPFTQVLMASLSRLRRESPDFSRHVRETANLIAHTTLPFAAICAVLPHDVVRLVLGPAWPAAAPLLRWLALGAAATYLGAPVSGICVAAGHARRLTAMAGLTLVTLVAALLLGRTHGPRGLAAAVAIANAGLLVPRLWWSARGTAARLADFATAFAGPAAVSMAIALGCLAASHAAHALQWGERLPLELASGLAAALAVVAVSPHVRGEVMRLWRRRVPVESSEPAPLLP